MRTVDDRAWWRRPRVMVALTGLIVLAAVAVVTALGRDSTDPPEPVVASTHDGYPARGSLVAAGGWEPEAEAAAEAWRALPPGGAAEPPEPGRQIELMWAGDVEAHDLPYGREHLRDDETGELGTARVVLLQAFNRLAVVVAPVGADGERTDDYTLVTETAEYPDDAALSARDGLLLLAETPDVSDASDAVEVAGHDDPVTVHDGLVLDAPDGIAWRERATPRGQEDYHGLVLTESGETLAVQDDSLWQALTDPATTAQVEKALRDAFEAAAPRTGGSALVFATLWEPVELENGRTMSVVALQADGVGGRDPSWVVTGGVDVPGGTGDPRSVRLGTGQPPGLVHAGDRRGVALAARWFEPEVLGTTLPQLVVVGGDAVTEVEVLTSDGVRQVPGAAAALPAWEDGGSGPVMSRAVVVGRDTDGVPVTPIPAGDGHPPAPQ